MSFLPTVTGHAGAEHAGGLENWTHYLSSGEHILPIGLIVWAGFLLFQAYGLRRNRFKAWLQAGFAALNIAAAMFLQGDNLPAGLILLSAGFLLLIWTLFGGKTGRQRLFQGEAGGRG